MAKRTGKSKAKQKQNERRGKLKRVPSPNAEGIEMAKKLLETERLLDEMWRIAQKAKPAMSEEEALVSIHEWLRRRAERILGRR
ncbi:MAG: hypothetical protein N3B10_02060 [Armatimonadetes bacterium]|nr:hypothetical protein [Armatimonadota bacterium]